MMRRAALLLALVACSKGTTPKLDSGTGDDGPPFRDGAEVDTPAIDALVIDGPPGAHRHTIVVDGTDDFVAAETFPTTSNGYDARVTWDDQFVYVGYSGPDLDPTALDAGFKWLFVYLDVDPGTATGATSSQTYNTQTAMFPTGFGAEHYARWKCDASYSSIETHDSGAWSTSATTLVTGRANAFVEIAIPRSLFGGADKVGLVTWMINEKPNFEGSFAGLYANNFTDGYAMTLPLTKYLQIDFGSTRSPNHPENARP